MTYQPTRTYPRKRRIWPWVLVGAAALFACAGIGTLILRQTDDATAQTVIPATRPATRPTSAKPVKKGPPPPATIGGNDIVHVGEDRPAGTYRAVKPVDGLGCYWAKSTDAEGADLIDNDVVQGGRPQVTLKKGQWFRSQGCPDWAAK